ncbi:MAG TPA: secretin N-terminal domain-containing protein [Candidatus Binatia bacterium]
MRTDLLAAGKRSDRRRRAAAVLALAGTVAATSLVSRRLLAPFGSLQVSRQVALPAVLHPPAPPALPLASTASELKTRPLSAWLGDVARDANKDLVLSPDLRGDLTASASAALDWKQRLEAYAHVFGFDYSIADDMIEVRRPSPHRDDQTKGDAATPVEVAQPASIAAASPPAATSPAVAHDPAKHDEHPGASLRPRVVHLAHATAKDTATILAHAGETLGVSVAADAASNTLVLTGATDATAHLLATISELDRPQRRILLDAKIVECSRTARLDLGVEWKLTGTVGSEVKFPPPVSDAGSAALLIATHGASALDARLSALEASGKLRVVSRPSVVMLEGSPATVESARILRIRLPSHGTVVGNDTTVPASDRATEEIPVGVRLEVTPSIRGGSRVLLRIKAKSSSLGAPLPPDDIPEELSRMVDAEVLVTSGETAVLGGLTREAATANDAGIPGIHHVPVLGSLFGKSSDLHEEEELLVLVTPRVLDDATAP